MNGAINVAALPAANRGIGHRARAGQHHNAPARAAAARTIAAVRCIGRAVAAKLWHGAAGLPVGQQTAAAADGASFEHNQAAACTARHVELVVVVAIARATATTQR